MKAVVSLSLLAGLCLALPQNATQGAAKTPKTALRGKEFEANCGNPLFVGDQDRLNKEECQGTNSYCFEKHYEQYGEKYNNAIECLKDRGVNPSSLMSKGVDRHFWDIEARNQGYGRLQATDSVYTRFMWLQRLQETVDSPALKQLPENERVRAATAEKDNMKKEVSEALESAKQNFKKAYKPQFAQEISDAIDTSKGDFERQWADFHTNQLSEVKARPEVSALLKKTNDLFNLFKVIENLDLQDVDRDNVLSATKESLEKVLEMADEGEKAAIAQARATLNEAWRHVPGQKIRKAVHWISEHQEKW